MAAVGNRPAASEPPAHGPSAAGGASAPGGAAVAAGPQPAPPALGGDAAGGAKDFSGVAVVPVVPAPDLATLAPPPAAPTPAPPPLTPILPPKRNPLTLGPKAAPLPPRSVPAGTPKKQPSRKMSAAVAAALDLSADRNAEDDVVVGVPDNAEVARAVADFMKGLHRARAFTGLSAFLLLALVKRVRLHVWLGANRYDLVTLHAPWASDFLAPAGGQFDIIGCQYCVDATSGVSTLHVVEDAHGSLLNHWVAGVQVRGCSDSAAVAADSAAVAAGATVAAADSGSLSATGAMDQEATVFFHAFYLSLNLAVVETIADGDCGLDAMCVVLGVPRRREVRQTLRGELVAFCLKHANNRALAACLYGLREIVVHLGLFELESAGAEMFENEHHGDGDGGGGRLGDGEAQREFDEEQVAAVVWKCGLKKRFTSQAITILSALSDNVVDEVVDAYRHRTRETKGARRVPVLSKRDSRLVEKLAAGKHFLHVIEERYS